MAKNPNTLANSWLDKHNRTNGTNKPSIDYDEIEKRKHENPKQSYARMKEQWKKEREELSKTAKKGE